MSVLWSSRAGSALKNLCSETPGCWLHLALAESEFSWTGTAHMQPLANLDMEFAWGKFAITLF